MCVNLIHKLPGPWLGFHITKHIFWEFHGSKGIIVKTCIAIYIVRVHESWCVQCTFYISTDRLAAEKNIPMLFHSPFNESTLGLAFLDIQVIHLHVNHLNVYTCIILFMWSILQSPIYLKYQSEKKVINIFIDLFTEMVSYCSCQIWNLYALLIKSYGQWDFFSKRNWQIHRQIGQNLHPFENCPFHGHIQIIFNSNMAKSATV